MSGSLDKIMTQIGTGKWSIFHFLALSYSNIIIVPHTFGRPFLAPKMEYKCKSNNSTTNFTLATAITTAKGANHTELDECYQMDGVTPCLEWDFNTTTYYSTITSEFSLVCDREHLRTAYQSVYLLGVLLGTPSAGYLADRYGRRSMVCFSTISYVLLALASAALPDFTAILVTRLLLGFLHGILLLVTYILVIEIAEPRQRTLLGISIYLIFAGSTMAWGALAYVLREWRILQTVASLPGLVFLPSLWFLDESPRWLAVRGRQHDAYQVLKKAAKWNNSELPKEDDVVSLLRAEISSTPSESESNWTAKKRVQVCLKEISVLISTPYLRNLTLLMSIIYVLASMIYFGLSLSGSTLSDSPFAYMALSGLMEVPAYTLTIPLVNRLGRRIPSLSGFLFCGLTLLILAALPQEYIKTVMGLALVGKLTSSAAFMIFYYHSSELFPTEVRSRGMGTCGCMSRIGSILAPYILDFVGSSRPWAASLVFGFGSIVAAVCTGLLPETKGRALPDTVAVVDSNSDQDNDKTQRRHTNHDHNDSDTGKTQRHHRTNHDQTNDRETFNLQQ